MNERAFVRSVRRRTVDVAEISRGHGLRTPREEIAFTARPKIHSHSQIFRYGGSIFCLPHRPIFSDIFDLCLHWVSVVRGLNNLSIKSPKDYRLQMIRSNTANHPLNNMKYTQSLLNAHFGSRKTLRYAKTVLVETTVLYILYREI